MDQLLALIDALRQRGAVKISTPEVSVEFAAPILPINTPETVETAVDPVLTATELERLMYVETSKM